MDRHLCCATDPLPLDAASLQPRCCTKREQTIHCYSILVLPIDRRLLHHLLPHETTSLHPRANLASTRLVWIGWREGLPPQVCVCGVWCVVCGVWCVVVWCVRVACGVWCVVCNVWRVACGVWRVARGVCACLGLCVCVCVLCTTHDTCSLQGRQPETNAMALAHTNM